MTEDSRSATGNYDAPEVFYILGALQLGGAERHITAVTEALVRIGWHVTVYVLFEDGPLHQALLDSGATVIFPPLAPAQPSWSRGKRLSRLVRLEAHLYSTLRHRRPAVVHMVLPGSYVLGMPAAILARMPVRVMSRLSMNVYQKEDWRYRVAERCLHRHATAILANARALISELRCQEGVPPERLGLVYLGVHARCRRSESERTRTRTELGVTSSTVVVSVVANLIPYKGHSDLIDALALAAPRLKEPWCVWLIGRDQGLGNTLRAQAMQRSVADNVRFLGERRDVEQLLDASDIGLLCSHQEGFSVAVLESMSAGLPMIVTDVGGNAEAVIDGETGIVVPPRQPIALADAIVRVVNDKALQQRCGNASRERILDHFTIEHCANVYDQLYRALMVGGKPSDVAQIRTRP